jgi:hypothetical protein
MIQTHEPLKMALIPEEKKIKLVQILRKPNKWEPKIGPLNLLDKDTFTKEVTLPWNSQPIDLDMDVLKYKPFSRKVIREFKMTPHRRMRGRVWNFNLRPISGPGPQELKLFSSVLTARDCTAPVLVVDLDDAPGQDVQSSLHTPQPYETSTTCKCLGCTQGYHKSVEDSHGAEWGPNGCPIRTTAVAQELPTEGECAYPRLSGLCSVQPEGPHEPPTEHTQCHSHILYKDGNGVYNAWVVDRCIEVPRLQNGKNEEN